MADHKDYKISDKRRVHEGFLNLDEYTYDYSIGAGDDRKTKTEKRLVMERGGSAAILLHDEEMQTVVLTRQLRIAARSGTKPSEAWLLELPAGSVEPNEDPAECARREALEETGYAVRDCERIATFLPSPGSTSERIQIFYAKVTAADRTARGGGVEDEYIEVVEYPVRALNDDIDKGRLLDAKLLIAGQWLRAKHPQVAINPILSAGLGRSFHFREARAGSLPRVIGYKTGPIDDIMGIDAWINAENTDMQMARFFDKGISASIRYLGAARGTDGAIYEDSIADELRRAVSGQVFVRPGSVLVTGSGTLRKTHQVKKVFHVACVQHQRGGNTFTDINAGADGMSRAFEMAEEINNSLWGSLFDRSARPLRSALVPLIGAGNGGKDPLEVAEKLVPAALKYLERTPDATLREIYFIAFQKSHQDALEKVLGDKSLAERIEPAGGTKTAL